MSGKFEHIFIDAQSKIGLGEGFAVALLNNAYNLFKGQMGLKKVAFGFRGYKSEL